MYNFLSLLPQCLHMSFTMQKVNTYPNKECRECWFYSPVYLCIDIVMMKVISSVCSLYSRCEYSNIMCNICSPELNYCQHTRPSIRLSW